MFNAINTYHEHEQQQHQQKQHGLCGVRCRPLVDDVVSWGPLSDEFNGPPWVPVPMPRIRYLVDSSATLQDISVQVKRFVNIP